ncbi:9996_t:CDS:2 [Acaulospora colombiana]|uniref:9996_t:CDS:1 n=1 Tax=Acaulospora colombiana TaxID=27376 RepID=A0ACA9L3F7_9GLOM|nr:9996_t:CDS:2 [Acaulospora colombiana]
MWSLESEMDDITQEIKNPKSGHINNEYIHERLRVLEDRIPGIQNHLELLIKSIYTIRDSAGNAKAYLIDGESEAESALKEHWTGTIADYTLRKRIENELLQVRYIIKALQDLAPSLVNFEEFLIEYRRRIQDINAESTGVPKKLTLANLKYLKYAIDNLKEQHEQYSSAVKQLGRKPLDDFNLEDKFSSSNRDCTEFRALLKKGDAYLIYLRIWSSDMENKYKKSIYESDRFYMRYNFILTEVVFLNGMVATRGLLMSYIRDQEYLLLAFMVVFPGKYVASVSFRVKGFSGDIS